MTRAPYLSVVVPAYNEGANFDRGTLDHLPHYLDRQGYPYEILIVDDGSSDDTAARADRFAGEHTSVRVFRSLHRGKAEALKTGIEASTGQLILFTDFDQATPIEEIEKLLPYFPAYDVVIGSRRAPGARIAGQPVHRRLMGMAFNVAVRLIAVPGIRDSQAGFKCFKADWAKEICKRLCVYGSGGPVEGPRVTAVDVEMLAVARSMGGRIKEVPINWHHVQTNNINPMKDSWRMLIDTVKIRLATCAGAYRRPTVANTEGDARTPPARRSARRRHGG